MTSSPTTARMQELADTARRVRVEIIRASAATGGGHLGGDLSSTDILVALFFEVMRVRPEEPDWDGRDRFVLSKGHGALAMYATMAIRGYFDESEMATFCQIDSRLQPHPDMTKLPGVDMSSGSLGLGISAAVGMALGARLGGHGQRVYVLAGDGECQEGSVWEAAYLAARNGLDNLTVIVDVNGLQQFGWAGASPNERLAPFDAINLGDRWRAFGWEVLQTDGNELPKIISTLRTASEVRGRPVAVMASTVKGKGVPFMEGQYLWHGKAPSAGEAAEALKALGEEARS